jgi:tetratricopeptide (TPR) repeat protein
MALYRQVIEQHQDDKERAVSWNSLGNVYRLLEQHKEAMDAYRQAIKLDPTFTWPYHSLGAIYEEQGEYEEALALYQRAAMRHKQGVKNKISP